jgi:peptidoglycan/LPS O-acetylase OafA/YrhL
MVQSIQILRFFAAMWVAVFHASGWIQNPDFPDFYRKFYSFGFMGVDIFFAISGCVMALTTHQTERGLAPAGKFIGIRLARIYIGWWPAFLAYCAYFMVKGELTPEKDSLGCFLPLLLPLEKMLNPVTWTLAFEIYFYLLVGGFLFFNARHRDTIARCAFFVVAAYTAWMALTHRFDQEHFQESTIVMRFWLSPLLLEFLGGYLVCKHILNNPSADWRRWFVAVVVLAVACVLYQSFLVRHASGLEGFFHYPERALLMGGAACALVGCLMALDKKLPTQSRIVAFLSEMGDASYAIYLLHFLVLWGTAHWFLRINPQYHHRWLMYAAMLCLLAGISWAYHRILERPLYVFARGKISRFFSRAR